MSNYLDVLKGHLLEARKTHRTDAVSLLSCVIADFEKDDLRNKTDEQINDGLVALLKIYRKRTEKTVDELNGKLPTANEQTKEIIAKAIFGYKGEISLLEFFIEGFCPSVDKSEVERFFKEGNYANMGLWMKSAKEKFGSAFDAKVAKEVFEGK